MEEINFNQLKRLWNLKLVIETGSIKRAATKANVTSSAMSQSISNLEEVLGRKLILRKKDHLLPTEYGTQLLKSAEAAFSSCFILQKNLNHTQSPAPRITWMDFAAAESLAVDILPPIMQRLRSQFPGIRLKAKSGRSSELTKLVKKSELCMAVVEENEFIEGVQSYFLTEDQLGFYCSPKLLGTKNIIDKIGVGVLSTNTDGRSAYFTKFINLLGKGFKPTLTSDSYEMLRSAAVDGSVVAVLPSRVAHRKRGELVEIEKELSKGKHAGKYKIYLISEPGCSAEENVFLANELKSVIGVQQ